MTRNGRARPNLRPNQGIEGLPEQMPKLKSQDGGHRPDFSQPSRKTPGIHSGRGVHRAQYDTSRQSPHLSGDSGASGSGIHATAFDRKTGGIYDYMAALQARLRRTRVVCGDWQRIMGPSVTYKIGMTGVFLDPPYGNTRQDNLYAVDSLTIADDVRAWCLEEIEDGKFKGPRFAHPKLRIALSGLDGEHNELEALGWDVAAWKANGGYGNQRADGSNQNAGRERIWFSPNCLPVDKSLSGIMDTRDYNDLPLMMAASKGD